MSPQSLLGDLNVRYELNVPLASYTWYRVGGPARAVVYPATQQQLSAIVVRCREQAVPIYVLGSGANLLVADAGIDGVIVRLTDPSFGQIDIDGPHVTAGAGCDLMRLVLRTARAGLGGLSCLAGIPASVGGAIRMNAGGSYGLIGTSVARLQVMDDRGHVRDQDRKDLIFDYRRTNISARFILKATFALIPEDPLELRRQVKDIFLQKKQSQPLAAQSSGCAFVNPHSVPSGVPPTAGQLIDQAGLKGFRIGGAHVSHRHANFVIADRDTTAAEVLAVLEHVEATVADRFGLHLVREIVTWP